MILMILFWLEWLEYLSLLLTIISLFIYFLTKANSFFFITIIITLILNIINRFRSENRTKSRIAAALNVQLRRFSAEVAEINQKIELFLDSQKKITLPPKIVSNVPKSENEIVALLQEDVESLNKSITSIIDYVQDHKIEQRIKTLEQLYQAFQSSRKNADNPNKNDVKLPDQKVLTPPPENYDIEPPPKIAWRCIHIINAHNQSVTDLAITHDNKYIFSTSWDQFLKVWSLDNGSMIDEIKASEQGVLTVAVSANNYQNHSIVTGSLDQDLKIWSLKGGKNQDLLLTLNHTLTQHTGSIHGLEIASSSNLIVSGSYDQTLKQWDLATGKLLESCFDDSGSINAIAIHEGEGYIATGGGDGVISLWQLGGNQKLGLLVGNVTSLESIAISKSGQKIAVGCVDGSIKIWHLPTTKFNIFLEVEPTLELHGHHGQVMDLIFSPDDKLLYSGGVDGLVKIWYPASAKELGHLKIAEDNRIFSLSLSKNGLILAAGGVDGTIKIWQQTVKQEGKL